jgi:hypothetical protein
MYVACLNEVHIFKTCKIFYVMGNFLIYIIYILLLLFTAIGFSPGGSSPYTSTHNTTGNIIYIKVTIQNKLYTITKQNTYIKYKYTQ